MSSQTSSSSLVSGETAKHSPRAVPSWRWAAFLVGVVTLTFPPLAVPVYAGLDPSWVIGLHEALERGLVFGRDIGFTYGPLGHMFYPLNKGTPLTISTLLLLTLYTTWWISVALVMARLRGNAKVSLFWWAP